ncbi:hypothetical protein [Elstera sp.]|uniref:hypothetical protein n=1 Tax=Elstera sp. TaxID=1916664 RepID=UPI0037BF04CE
MLGRAYRWSLLGASLSLLAGCGDTVIRIGTPVALQSDRETRLVPRAVSPAVPASQSPSAPATPPTDPAPTPLERAPGLAAEPPSAAPLPLAASPGQGQGEGLKADPLPAPVMPVSRTVPFSEALRVLADHHGIRLATSLSGDPSVEIAPTPGSDLAANVRGLLAAVSPPHYAAVSLNGDGLPTALIIAPHPIVGGFSK